MSFNTAPKLLTAGQFLVISFMVLFGQSGSTTTPTITVDPVKQRCVTQVETATETINANTTLSEDEKNKKLQAAQKTYEACLARANSQQTQAEKEADRKKAQLEKSQEKCEEAIEKFNDTYGDFGKSCKEAGLSGLPSRCYSEINTCQGKSKRSSSRRNSTAKVCDLYTRSGLDDKMSDREDKYDLVQDLTQEISELNNKIQDIQAEQKEVVTAYEEENQLLIQAAEDITIKLEDDLEQMGYAQEDGVKQIQQTITQLKNQRKELQTTRPSQINDGYAEGISQINEKCIDDSLSATQKHKEYLAKRKSAKRTNKGSLSRGASLKQYFNAKNRACNKRAKSRIGSLSRARNSQLRALEAEVETTNESIKAAEASLLQAIERADKAKNKLIQRALRDFQRQQQKIDQLAKKTNDQLNKLSLSITQTQKLIMQKQQQLAKAEQEFAEADQKMKTAKSESGNRDIDSDTITEIFTGHNESRNKAQAVVNKCGCSKTSDRLTSDEQCGTVNTITGTKPTTKTPPKSSGSSGTTTSI